MGLQAKANSNINPGCLRHSQPQTPPFTGICSCTHSSQKVNQGWDGDLHLHHYFYPISCIRNQLLAKDTAGEHILKLSFVNSLVLFHYLFSSRRRKRKKLEEIWARKKRWITSSREKQPSARTEQWTNSNQYCSITKFQLSLKYINIIFWYKN